MEVVNLAQTAHIIDFLIRVHINVSFLVMYKFRETSAVLPRRLWWPQREASSALIAALPTSTG